MGPLTKHRFALYQQLMKMKFSIFFVFVNFRILLRYCFLFYEHSTVKIPSAIHLKLFN
jgi:hypothetical protein